MKKPRGEKVCPGSQSRLLGQPVIVPGLLIPTQGSACAPEPSVIVREILTSPKNEGKRPIFSLLEGALLFH